MSDIDFDELDRAVNGVLGTNDTPAPSAPVPEAPVEPKPEATTITRVERTQLSPVSSSSKPTVTSTAPAARRSSGRFMDMVHPSSDMRSRTNDAPLVVKPEVTPKVEPAPTTTDYPESPAWNEPLESPFLPDAKVEKRPLGGGEATSNEATSIVDSFDFQGLLDEPEEELLEAPEPQERIEATALPDPIDFAEANAAPEEAMKVEEIPVVEKPEIVTPEPQPQLVAEAPQPIVEEPIGPTSITPQYKEQVSSNQESGAMYDTESYHQAVTAPVKKKSGWFTVILILLLVVLGAGGGFAMYTYVLPML
jgi:hypothetical protein